MRALWVTVLLAGYMDGLPTEAPGVARAGACTALDGLTFQSVQQGECGLGPDGPTACAWHLKFVAADATHSTFVWSHSDVEESGSVACNGGTVETLGSPPAFRYSGTFDDAKLDLTWDARAYALAP